MSTVLRQKVCACCESFIETKGGCSGSGPGWLPCAVKDCTCLTPPTETLCEDCYLWEK